MTQHFKLVFSTIYGNKQKDQQIAKVLFQEVIDFIRLDQKLLRDKKHKTKLVDLLTKASNKSGQGSMQIIFKCSYGCSIIITKQKKESPIGISINSLEQWTTGARDWREKNIDFQEPQDSRNYRLLQVTQYSTPLEIFFPDFKGRLQSAIKTIIQQKDKQMQNMVYDVPTIEKACKIAAKKGRYTTSFTYQREYQERRTKQQKREQVYMKSGQSIPLNQSQANTSWYVPQRLVVDLIKTNQKYKDHAEQIIIGFKTYILEKVTRLKADQGRYDQADVRDLKKCLDHVIQSYRNRVSINRQKFIKVQNFREFIGQIKNNIRRITNGGLTSKIEDLQQKPNGLPFAQPKNPSIAHPYKQVHNTQLISHIDICQYPLSVHKRLPFQELVELYQKIEPSDLVGKDKWILLAERTFFSLAGNFDNQKTIIDLNIHMREIQCEIGASNLCLVVQGYDKIVNSNLLHYGMGMEGQANSHIQLVKTIAAVIAFQSVQMNRQRNKSNLSKYRVPIDIQIFYKAFISHSYQARKAMKQLLIYYDARKNRLPIFILNGRSDSFQQFGRLLAQQTRSSYPWSKNAQKIRELQKQIVCKDVQIEQLNGKLTDALSYFAKYNGTTNVQNYINQVNSKDIISNQKAVLSEFNQRDPWLFAFLNNIPSDVLGLIKVLAYAQNPVKDLNIAKNNLFQQHFTDQKFPIRIFSQKPEQQTNRLSSNKISVQIIPVVNNFNQPKIMLNDSSFGRQIQQNTFQQVRNLFHSVQDNSKGDRLNYILSPVSDLKTRQRQHRLYANQLHRPQQIEVQDFLAIGNVRSAQNTQLMVLCLNILQRKVISNSFNKVPILAQQTILQTAGQLSTYHKQTEKSFSQIRNLIKQFINVWAFTDVNFCPILGPFLGYISREITDDQIPNKEQIEMIKKVTFQICKKCILQYERGEEQLLADPQIKNRWDQRFISTAAICCFRQIILTQQDQEQLMKLCELIFIVRTCKILSDRQEKPLGIRSFETELTFSVEKAIYYNIQQISNFLNKKKQNIGLIIVKMDPSYPDDVVWKRDNTFSFSGKSQGGSDVYQIDLFQGRIYKNGKEISALDKQIKENPYFQQIFGKNRQFQVFQSHYPHFVRTKNHVNQQFEIPLSKGLIFFEFSENGKQIRHIIQNANGAAKDEDVWVLVPKQRIKQSNCFFPKLYLEHYLAWYSQRRKCIIFRKTKFQQMYSAGIVLHLQEGLKDLCVLKSYQITYHGSFKDQSMDQLCDFDSIKYEQIILRNKDIKLSQVTAFKMLSRFEDPQYILQLRNKKKKQVQYLLHRYQIRFKLSQETRLESQTYIGYSLDCSFYQNQNSLFNKFPCLVLQKNTDDPAYLNNHKRIVIISDGQIKIGGTIGKTKSADEHIESFKYQIHDFFGDLRGINRQSLLHLSAVMLSINDNIKISSIQMTPLDYSIYLLNSCLNNRPLTVKQLKKIDNIINNLKPAQSTVLMCLALWECAKALQNILPFQKQYHYCKFNDLKDQIIKCKSIYQKRYKDNLINYRQKINVDLLNYLNIKVEKKQIKQSSSSSQSSQSGKETPSSNKNSIYWRKVVQFTGQSVIQNIKQIKRSFDEFQITTKKMNVWKQVSEGQNIKVKKISKKIRDLSGDPKSNQMTKQLVDELEESYDIFFEQESRIQAIAQKLKGDRLKQQVQVVNELIRKSQKTIEILEDMFDLIKKQNQNHPDVLTGIRPTISFICFTKILCGKNIIRDFFPAITQNAEESIRSAMIMWIELKTRVASLQRVMIILKAHTLDIVALMRQVLSPRQQVRKKYYWLCFQAENKVQLWSSQLDTYNNLTQEGKSGNFCQLNMGQGKTQVIIPMIILDVIYSKQKSLPRINLLASLMEQARGNFFRFLSVTSFQIPGFQLPFTREVQLNKLQISSIINLIDSFSNTLYILMSRQSRLSQILKYYQTSKVNKEITMKQWPIIPCKIYDIFDEIDALMTSVKSYIFSIGDTDILPSAPVRLQLLRRLLQIFLNYYLKQSLQKKFATTEQTQKEALKMVYKGRYPPGLRLNYQDVKYQQKLKIRRNIARDLIRDPTNNYFSFLNKLVQAQEQELIQFMVNPLDTKAKIPDSLIQNMEKVKNQILIIRGALGYGIFQHCLSMRCGVDYGVPNHQHKKRIVVPYEAADIPSKTSQFQQPDVSTILSYCAYYTKGLGQDQFTQAIILLLSLSNTSKQLEYDQWFKSLCKQDQKELKIKNVHQINSNSKSIKKDLFECFRFNRRAIAFWLIRCVFPTNLRQYQESICASAWDLADVQYSVGFSGTKDNRWLYSNKLTWKPCQTPAIKGTDGKMLHLITKNTKQIVVIEQDHQTQWERFVDLALNNNVGCIIDAGALCVGKSLQKQIVPWIAEHCKFDKEKYAGISFCDEGGKWKVYDIEAKYYVPRGRSIPDHQTFVIFDEARTRGADLKMSSNVTAAISLGPKMTKDKFMQAAGRLRKLGRDQKLIIMATDQLFSTFLQSPADVAKLKTKMTQEQLQHGTNQILAWCCKNSIESNQKLLVQFANLGWNYIKSKLSKNVFVQSIDTTLGGMYQAVLQKKTVAELSKGNENKLEAKYKQDSSGKHIIRILGHYGKNVYKLGGSSLDDVCEREVQAEKQLQKQQQDATSDLSPLPQKDELKIQQTLAQVPLVFDKKFGISQNFMKTTSHKLQMGKSHQLGQLYFLIYNQNQMKAITLRQASLYINKHIINKEKQTERISLLSSLSIQDQFIKQHKLEFALISAKFLAGVENYTLDEEEYLLDILMKSSKIKKQWQDDYGKLTSSILRKKRNYLKKYAGSTLDKIVVKLGNQRTFVNTTRERRKGLHIKNQMVEQQVCE